MCRSAVTETMLDRLRTSLEQDCENGKMSKKRFFHTCEVEKMAARLGEIFAPEKINILRAAALLHDITKECSLQEQIELADRYGIKLTDMDICASKTLHAMTAAACIDDLYPEFALPEIKSCVRWHTTGHAKMSLTEKLIYLADYIDMSRKFDDCVMLREYFFCDGLMEMSKEEQLSHLDDTILLSYDITLAALIEKKTPISPDTISARNEIAVKKCLKK